MDSQSKIHAHNFTTALARFFLAIALLSGGTALGQGSGLPLRVNAGGSAYTDTSGNLWSADTGFNSGSLYSTNSSVAGTSDPTLFKFGRFDPSPSPPTLLYSFPVPNGWYEVSLYFAEPGLQPGGRKFNVRIEGAPVFTNLDVAAEAGVLTALIKKVNVRVIDGQLDLEFLHGAADNPLIDAIQVVASSAPTTPTGVTAAALAATQVNLNWTTSTSVTSVTGYRLERCQGSGCTSFVQIATPAGASYVDSGLLPSTTYRYRVRSVDNTGSSSSYSDMVSATTLSAAVFSTLRVNAGGGAYTDSLGQSWVGDTGFNSGTVYSAGCSISGTSDQTLYKVGRFDPSPSAPILEYDFAAPNGTYQVNLYFAEPAFGAGGRKFNVVIQGATAFSDLDIAAEAGTCKAHKKTATAQVSSGQISLQFLHGSADNPFIDAIEIIQAAAVDVQAPTVPTGLSANVISSSRIDLTWSTSTDNVGVVGYHVERCQSASCTNFVDVGSATGTSFSDTGLSAQAAYSYRVRAVDGAGNYSAYSAPVTTATDGTDSQPPTPPASLTAVTSSSSAISLSWNPASDNVAVTAYRLERCQGTGCVHFSDLATPTGTSFADAGLRPGTAYSYRVLAEDAAGNQGAYSNVASATTLPDSGDSLPPSAPISAIAMAYSANRVDVRWAAATDNVAVTSYFIERCTGSNCTNFVQIAALPAITAYTDTGLSGGTSYRYRIRAADGSGNLGGYSPIATTASLSGSGTVGSATYEYDSFGRLKQVTVTPN